MRPILSAFVLSLLLLALPAPHVSAGPDVEPPAAGPHAAKVLLITADGLAGAWEPFAAWKTRCGKRTKIVTVGEIEAGYEGDDLQQKIRACVLDHVASDATRWIVLGGDSAPDGGGLVPDRDTSHRLFGRMAFADIPTDLYYVSATDWDANDDGIYGQWDHDRDAIEYTGRAVVGRIPVRTAEDVAAYTEKVIAYESRYPQDTFATRFLYTCSVAMANYKADMVWDEHLSAAWEVGECFRFFTNVTPWDEDEPGDYDLSPDHWRERLNAGTAGKMHMHGHGLLPGWILEHHEMVTAETVAALENEDAYPVLTTVSCFTGHFDAEDDPSIAEAMIRKPRGGAVLVVAPSRPGVPIFHDWGGDPRDGNTQDGTTRTLTSFWRHGLSRDLTAGEAMAAAREEMTPDAEASEGFHWCQCEIVLLGDPTLDLRARVPVRPEVGAPRAIARGASTVSIETGLPGVTICLWKGDEVYEVATADDTGRAEIDVAPTTGGDMRLTVCGPSVNTYTGIITVR
ncbi:MAG: C25 family cysteine peptidase [Planctomycetota bacterium]|jgi:hypothetical protein